jgi:hypothetical protein
MRKEAPGSGWRQLREFAGVDLGRSYVLSWHVQGDRLTIDVDLCLESEHPFYEQPRPAESSCIRPAVIEFLHCEHVRISGSAKKQPNEIIDEIGIGAISDLHVMTADCYELQGEFGTVLISAEGPILRMKGP